MLWNAKNGKIPLGGTSISYARFGHGPKTLVILPGLSDGLTTVDGKALLLAKPYARFLDAYTVYMFSRRDELPEGFGIRDMARDQAQALEALGLTRVSVLGVSEGGMIAQYLAIDHAPFVEKLVLAVTAPCPGSDTRSLIEGWIALAERGDHKALMIDTAEHSYTEPYLKKYRRIYPLLGHIGRPKNYRRFLVNARAILSFDASLELPRIACPTLVISGGQDRIVGPEAARTLAGQIQGSELFIYESLGHAAYEEAPDFNDRVFEFLDRQ